MKGSDNGPVVSCLLETNQSQAITFKFDLREADVSAISYKMVGCWTVSPVLPCLVLSFCCSINSVVMDVREWKCHYVFL